MSTVNSAIEKTLSGKQTFCKLLSPNDSGETGGHQSGFLISKQAKSMLFSEKEMREHIAKRSIKICWQDDFYTDGNLTWYESKGELRITGFMKGFPFRGSDYTGALFVLIRETRDDYDAYIFNTEEEIDEYLNAFGISPAETNRMIYADSFDINTREKMEIDRFISSLDVEFPNSDEMSQEARVIAYITYQDKSDVAVNPDKVILEWTKEEYSLFRSLEQARYGKTVSEGFNSVDDFVVMANKVLNRRKSRAGKSLEHHLCAIFDENNIQYTAQAVTEGNKRPDFLFPSSEAYHDFSFPENRLVTLAAKTTCKDRWRQILNEADRLRDSNKYLCTLQQSISAAQMDEMEKEKVILVVPREYIRTYPADRRNRIWTISRFVNYVKDLESSL